MPYKSLAEKRAYDRRYWLKIKGSGPGAASNQYARAMGTAQEIVVKGPAHGLKIAVLPDAQVAPGVPLDHLAHYGSYIAEKRPDAIVCVGDFGDFPSLSRFDRGTRHFEGRRYTKDLDAFKRGMDAFMVSIATAKGYRPAMHFCLGNHEDHITRATIEDAKLEGLISIGDLNLPDYGWTVHDFLQPIVVGGVAFSHYYPSGIMGKPISNAADLLRKLHMSAYAGHQQGREIAYSRRADGGNMTAIISGSFFQHDSIYLSPFTNAHWRGAYFLHEVKNGQFDEMALSIPYLKRRFG